MSPYVLPIQNSSLKPELNETVLDTCCIFKSLWGINMSLLNEINHFYIISAFFSAKSHDFCNSGCTFIHVLCAKAKLKIWADWLLFPGQFNLPLLLLLLLLLLLSLLLWNCEGRVQMIHSQRKEFGKSFEVTNCSSSLVELRTFDSGSEVTAWHSAWHRFISLHWLNRFY